MLAFPMASFGLDRLESPCLERAKTLAFGVFHRFVVCDVCLKYMGYTVVLYILMVVCGETLFW